MTQANIIYYILDTETTGLAVDVHEINQISVMRVSDAEQVSLQIAVAHPNIYNAQALEIQGITPKDLREGVSIQEAVESINLFMAEDGKTKAHRCIVAHNAPFDRKFVHRAWEKLDLEFPADLWMCTQSFGKRYVKKFGGDKIAKAQYDAGIDVKPDKAGKLKPKFGLNNFMVGIGLTPKIGAHSADIDVKNTLTLYHWLMNSKTEHISLIERIPHREPPKTQDLDVDDF
jgi:DNA polymerase III epsilon subunit-like protein